MTNIIRHKNILYLSFSLIVFNLFFINKAFHIDDPFTIDIARAVNQNFLYVPHVFSNPILLGYYYASVIRLFGENEISMHIFHLPFVLLAIISMYILSLRFIGKSILPTLLLATSPAFLIMSHNIMLDIPMLGFFLCALATFIYGTDRHDNRLLFLSAILAGVASLIKYSGLMLIPIMFLYALLHSQRRSYLFLIIPICLFFIWLIHNIIFYKHFPFIDDLLIRLKEWSPNIILIRIFACLSFISGTSISSLLLLPFFLCNKNNAFLLFISLPIGLCPFILKNPFAEYPVFEKSFLSLLFISSLFIILIIFKISLFCKKSYSKDKLFLFLWFFIFLIFNIFCQFVTARFILLLFPPMFLIMYNELIVNHIHLSSIFKKAIKFVVLFTILLSTILAIGDYHFAGVYRDFIKYLKKEIPADSNIYSCSASYSYYYSWGYSYYLNKYYPQIATYHKKNLQDILFITPSELVLPIVIQNLSISPEFNNPDFYKISIERFSHVFLHNRKHHTGFYSYDWGLLPFKISLFSSTLEKFYIYRFVAPVEKNG